jgi:iron complex outermembrane receptor protein
VDVRALIGMNILLLMASTGAVAAEEADGLQEITVTATRRPENLQNVATSATVFSGNDIAKLGILEPRDLAEQTPGMLTKFGPNGLATVGFYIRGVGINDFTGTVDPSVGIYVDEIFMPTPDMLNFSIFDMERVEVLRGPQGTLYGRNSTAGAVNFIVAKPTAETTGYIRAGWGSYGTSTAEGAVSGSLTDTLRGRISFSGTTAPRDRGYSYNQFDGSRLGRTDSIAVRGQLQWLPTEDFSARLSYTYGVKKADEPMLLHVGARNPANLSAICAPVIAGQRSEGACVDLLGYSNPSSNLFTGSSDLDPFLTMQSSDIALTLQWKLPFGTLNSISGFDDFTKRQTQDIDASPHAAADNRTFNHVKNYSQELRLTSNDTLPFTWIVGADYAHTTVNWFQTLNLTDLLNLQTSNGANQTTESTAVFGQSTYAFTKQFEFTGGVRYTDEKRKWVGGTFVGTFADLASAFASGAPYLSAIPLPSTDPNKGGPLDFPDSLAEHRVDYSAVFRYKPTDDIMAYVSTGRAFRSGGFSSAVIFSQNAMAPYGAETLTSYEVGFKMTAPELRMRLNMSAFLYYFNNFQATFVRATEANARLQNAGDVHEHGLETSIDWFPISRLTANLGVSLLHTEIVRSDVVLSPLNGSPATTIVGNEIPNAPHYTFNGRVRYDAPILPGYNLGLQTDFVKVGAHFLEPNNRAVLKNPGYFLVNARVSLSPDKGPWEVAVWGRNLTDKVYYSAAQDLMQSLGFAEIVLSQPRTWGVEAEYHF